MNPTAYDVATYAGFLTVAVIEALNEAWKTEAHMPPNVAALSHYVPLTILIALGIAWVWRFLRSNKRPDHTTPSTCFQTDDWHKPLKLVVNQTYRNETAELDGKSFIDCRFENVTFHYNGTKPFQFTNCSRPSEECTVKFQSENPIVLTTFEMANWLRAGRNEKISRDLINKDQR